MEGTESLVHNLAGWLRLVVETTGAAIVGLGFLVAAFRFVRESLKGDASDFTVVRLILARYLALALEFQLGADILSTAIAPTWDQIGKLAAIAVVRTGLNYFLSLEMKGEEATRRGEAKLQR
jgi:uncharacterized membrane protein